MATGRATQTHERTEDDHVLHRALRSLRRRHPAKGTPSLDTIPFRHNPARGNPVPEKEVEEQCSSYWNPSQAEDDAVLVRKIPSVDTEAG